MNEYDQRLYGIIGDMIRDIRIGNGYTLAYVADKLNLTMKTVQRYEKGERKIKISTLIDLSNILGFEYEQFMEQAHNKIKGIDANEDNNNKEMQIIAAYNNRPELKSLFDAACMMNKENIELLLQLSAKMKKRNKTV